MEEGQPIIRQRVQQPMQEAVEARSTSTLQVITVLLLAAHTLFLWMFFAAESVEEMAAHGQVSGYGGVDLYLVAGRFAARWRHGMAGNSPLYMPRFFAVGALTWIWSLGRPMRRLVPEGLAVMSIATVIAACLAPLGAVHAVRSFEQSTGFSCAGVAPGFTFVSAVASIYTLLTWSAGIICSQLSIARRSVKPMGVPIVLNVILLRLRPWAVNDYTTQWI